MSWTDCQAVILWQEKRSHQELEHLIFRGTSFGKTERLFLAFGDSYADVILRLPEATMPKTIVIVERPAPLTFMQTCESTLAASYLPTLPTEGELKEIAGRLLGLLRKPVPSKISQQISELGAL